jgi:hypothetical protein
MLAPARGAEHYCVPNQVVTEQLDFSVPLGLARGQAVVGELHETTSRGRHGSGFRDSDFVTQTIRPSTIPPSAVMPST